jgi:hypothetical protein
MIALGYVSQLRAQNTEEQTYDREFLYGLNFHTNGGLIGGVMFKYATAINSRNYHTLSIEAINVKHPKEVRYINSFTGSTLIFGKSNYLYNIRPLYGIEHIFFRKAREKGIQVSGMASVGPTFGVVAPYMVRKVNGELVQYNPNIDVNDIQGSGSFFDGLGKSEFEIGFALKTSLFFELGAGKRNVAGFEVGFTLDRYANEIILIPESANKNVYTAGFLSLYYGIRK